MKNEPSDGVIKFKFSLKMSKSIEDDQYIDIEKWRVILFKMNFVGECPREMVGYGNLSRRTDQDRFIITGSQTGKYQNLSGKQYTKVVKCNLKKMSVEACGPIAPSSESLTHYAIYKCSDKIQYVFHIHNLALWDYMLKNGFPKTDKSIPYGTYEMAKEVEFIIGEKTSGILAMEGHQDGIISYGTSAEEAGKNILDVLKQSKS